MLSINKDQKRNKVIEKRLLTKKDFLELSKNMYKMLKNKDYHITEKLINTHTKALKQMKVNELRELFKLTHSIDGNFKDMRGNCFSCLTSLRHDYTSKFDKNYCIDCL